MLVIIFSLLTVVFIGSATINAGTAYKISMVSSQDSPGRPALFYHAESPVWDPEGQILYFVDVHKQNVHQLDYNSGKISTKHIAYGQVNVVSLVANSRRLLVAVRAGLYLLNWAVAGDAAIRLIATVDDGCPDNVINEGKPDTHGRFWAGTKGPQSGDDVSSDKATLYRVEQGAEPHVALRPVSISNGLVFSLNNSVMYYVDSPSQKVEAFNYDARNGELSTRRTILDITTYGYDDAIPDGMTIDSEGHLWVALMFGGAILHINPDTRELVFGYKLPVSRVTSVTWGGPNMDELFVTTGRDELNAKTEPLGGAIFTIRDTGSQGLAPNLFKFHNADTY